MLRNLESYSRNYLRSSNFSLARIGEPLVLIELTLEF
jgi:hypothetical protein